MSELGQHTTLAVCPQSRHKYFDFAEASRAIVLVKRIVADVVVEYRRLLDLHEAMEAAEARCADDLAERTRDDMADASEKLRICLQELEDVGVRLTDWSLGAVEFPSVTSGREVNLCWRFGQDGIRQWRPAHGGACEPIETLLAEQKIG